jgi:NADH-quinone oxidoreductase subunit N
MFRSVMIADPATIALAVIAAVNAVIALYYYTKVIKAVWLDDPKVELTDEAEAPPAGSLRLALGVAVALTVAIGVYPSIAAFVRDAAHVLASGG